MALRMANSASSLELRGELTIYHGKHRGLAASRARSAFSPR